MKTSDKDVVTLRALGTAINSMFTIVNVCEREGMGKILSINTFDLKDEDHDNQSKLGCEIKLSKNDKFSEMLGAYKKSVEDARGKNILRKNDRRIYKIFHIYIEYKIKNNLYI